MSNKCHCNEFVGGCAIHRDEETVFEQFTDIMFNLFDQDEMAYAHVEQQQAIYDEMDGNS